MAVSNGFDIQHLGNLRIQLMRIDIALRVKPPRKSNLKAPLKNLLQNFLIKTGLRFAGIRREAEIICGSLKSEDELQEAKTRNFHAIILGPKNSKYSRMEGELLLMASRRRLVKRTETGTRACGAQE
ncbi:hypothetical protein RUM44_002622 [Polyplax serrata]|uniref:Anticodon-binding domain-containing protein n=1 Tax=Polyplax serrata TaxID=468196 RepID=A0ABR1AF97_POLSC